MDSNHELDKIRIRLTPDGFSTSPRAPGGLGLPVTTPCAKRCGCVYLAAAMLTFTDPGTLKTSMPPLILAIGMIPGAGIDSPSWW